MATGDDTHKHSDSNKIDALHSWLPTCIRQYTLLACSPPVAILARKSSVLWNILVSVGKYSVSHTYRQKNTNVPMTIEPKNRHSSNNNWKRAS